MSLLGTGPLVLLLAAPLLQAQTLVGVYASGLASTRPEVTPGTFVAMETTVAGGQLWSITGTDYTVKLTKGVPALTVGNTWTGAAVPFKTPWGGTVYTCAGLGGAVSTTSSGYSLAWCAFSPVPIKKGKWGYLLPGVAGIHSSIGGTSLLVRFGWGFKKPQ
jgi:hypothetical protein